MKTNQLTYEKLFWSKKKVASKLAEWHKTTPEFLVLYYALSKDDLLPWYLHCKYWYEEVLRHNLKDLVGMMAWGQATFTYNSNAGKIKIYGLHILNDLFN